MKAFDKKNDINLGKRAADAGITTAAAGLDAMAGGIPVFTATWAFCKAVLGNAMGMRQQRVYEWLEMVRDNPAIFRKEAMDSLEFQDAFVVALEDYIKIRTTLKRGIAQKIFMDYTATNDRDRFELERFNMTLRQISVDSLRFLGYIKHTVEPRQQKRVEDTMNRVDFAHSPMQADELRKYVLKQNPLAWAYNDLHVGSGTQIMIPDKPNPQYPGTQSSTGITIPDQTKVLHEQCLNELTSLGVFSRNRFTTPVSDINPETVHHDIWEYTDYGRAFAIFVENGQTIR